MCFGRLEEPKEVKPRELMSVGSVESIVVGGKDSDGTGIAGLISVFEVAGGHVVASDCHRTDRAPGIPQNEPDIRPGHPRCARVGYPLLCLATRVFISRKPQDKD